MTVEDDRARDERNLQIEHAVARLRERLSDTHFSTGVAVADLRLVLDNHERLVRELVAMDNPYGRYMDALENLDAAVKRLTRERDEGVRARDDLQRRFEAERSALHFARAAACLLGLDERTDRIEREVNDNREAALAGASREALIAATREVMAERDRLAAALAKVREEMRLILVPPATGASPDLIRSAAFNRLCTALGLSWPTRALFRSENER